MFMVTHKESYQNFGPFKTEERARSFADWFVSRGARVEPLREGIRLNDPDEYYRSLYPNDPIPSVKPTAEAMRQWVNEQLAAKQDPRVPLASQL
jgi:hypothetical protein